MYKPYTSTQFFIALAIAVTLSISISSPTLAGINAFEEQSAGICQAEAQCLDYCKSNLAGDGNPSADFCAQLFSTTFKKTVCTSKPFACPEEYKPNNITLQNGCLEYACTLKIPTYSPPLTTGSSQSGAEECKNGVVSSAKRIESLMFRPSQAQLERIARRGVVIPEELTQDMQTWENLLNQLQQYDDCSTILTESQALDTLMRSIDEKFQKLSRLAVLTQLKKNLLSVLNRAERDWGRAKKSAARLAAAAKLTERGDDILQQMSTLRATTLASVDEGLRGNFNTLTQIEQESEQLLELRDQLQNAAVTLNALVNARRQVTVIGSQYRSLLASVKKYKRDGVDTEELIACVADLKTALNEIRTASGQLTADYSAIERAFLNAEEVSVRCQRITQAISGLSSFEALAGQVQSLFKPLEIPNLSQYLGQSSEGKFVEEVTPLPRLYR